MADVVKQFQEAQGALIGRAVKDAAFRQELLANPKGTIEKYSGQKLPESLRVTVHQSDKDNFHLVVPKPVDASSLELTDEQLELVSGGEFFIGAAVVGIVSLSVGAGVGAGITIANEQTQRRHGW